MFDNGANRVSPEAPEPGELIVQFVYDASGVLLNLEPTTTSRLSFP